MEPVAAVQEAARLGLDAVCLTEHHVVWPSDELRRLEDAAQIRVLGGTEITTDQGDILVFGLDSEVEQVVPIAELRRMVEGEGGYMIAAHPFRGFLLFGLGQLGMNTERAAERPLFEYVDAVEVRNGRLTQPENDTAEQVAAYLGLPGVGGSDAHRLDEIGHCITVFHEPVADERQLVAALRAGTFSAEVLTHLDAE
jgi:predicted metal-dependent phosphoesterase TrpH